ncbi:hypothetical protein F8O53_16475, partial [Enterobacter sp. 63]
MSGFTGSEGNSIGGDSQFGNMGSNDPYGNNTGNVGAGGTGGAGGNGHSGDHETTSGSSGVGTSLVHTPYGDKTLVNGYWYMNGTKLTPENSTWVDYSNTAAGYVLNSLLDRTFKPDPGQHNTPTRLQTATNTVTKAQAQVKTTADKLAAANAAVTKAQIRLNAATAAIPVKQAAVTTAQTKYNTAKATADSFGKFANDMGGPGLHNFQVAGYQAGLAKSALDDANKALSNAQNEKVAAQKALDAAKAGVTAVSHDKQNADHALAVANQVKDDVSAVTSVLEHAAAKFGDKVARFAQDLACLLY